MDIVNEAKAQLRVYDKISHDCTKKLIAECESLRNQLAECQKDAERLNYLSNHDLTYRVLVQSQPSGNYVFDSCEVYKLREAIDQAMSEKG